MRLKRLTLVIPIAGTLLIGMDAPEAVGITFRSAVAYIISFEIVPNLFDQP